MRTKPEEPTRRDVENMMYWIMGRDDPRPGRDTLAFAG